MVDDHPTTADVLDTINDKINFWLTRGAAMAAECEHPDGGKQCFVCHRRDQLQCVMPGWGGVWACPDCVGPRNSEGDRG